MKFKTLMIITAILAVLFSIAFIFFPEEFMELYGGKAECESLKFTAQLFGAALFTIAVLAWSVRNLPDTEGRKAITLSFCLGFLVSFIISLIAQIGEVVNSLGWSTVGIYFLLTIGFGYLWLSKSSS